MADEKPQEKHKIKKKENAMKRIEKLILSFLCILTSGAFSGCQWVDHDGFLSDKTLEEAMVPDLPKLPHGKNLSYAQSKGFYTNITKDEFEQYVEQVFEYLLGNNFEYLGYEGEMITSLGGGYPVFEFKTSNILSDYFSASEEVSDFYQYQFIWTNTIDEQSNKLKNVQKLRIIYRESGYDLEIKRITGKENFHYNTNITIINGLFTNSTSYILKS